MAAKVKQHYYRIQTHKITADRDGWLITKLSNDLDVLATYLMSQAFDNSIQCNCPSRKQPCKHVDLLRRFYEANVVDAEEIFDPLRGEFVMLNQT